jgi:peptidoglycan hydrolase-like protein with peptidoglycan-binding domain
MADERVRDVQKWLNSTYGPRPGFSPVDQDGSTGWQTMFGLTRALQLELGISALSDTFGPTTMSNLVSQYGTIGPNTKAGNVIRILQCALWCKGYWGGDLTGEFGQAAAAVSSIRVDMGLTADAVVPPKLFKSLLNMDAYVLVGKGNSLAREAQQYLNGRYFTRADFRPMPCDGVFSRDVQQGLMYALQYEIGMADGTANGNFGPGTQSGLKAQASVRLGDSDGGKAFVRLFKAALIFNGRPPSDFSGTFDTSTREAAVGFQTFCELPLTGEGDFGTWASLLVSTGDPGRATRAADLATPLAAATASGLKSAGYTTVGRYLNYVGKRLEPGELDVIFGAGLDTFPIYQEWNDAASEFADPEYGYTQGAAAVLRARQLGFPDGTTIYISVDYDATNDEIDALIIPYYRRVKDAFAETKLVRYKLGVYGTRNVCTRLTEAGISESSFVSGMSTGYSGNLGFGLPPNWAYDQIATVDVPTSSGGLEIDKDVRSSRATPVNRVEPTPTLTDGAGNRTYDERLHWRIAQMCVEAEKAHTLPVPLSGVDLGHVVLYRIQMRNYSGAAFIAFAPVPGGGPGIQSLAQSAALDGLLTRYEPAFSGRASEGDGDPLAPDYTAYAGDFEHFALTLRGHLIYPPLGLGGWELSDLGGWALDLATAWQDYENARKAGTATRGPRDFLTGRIGGTSGSFGEADLISDIDAYLAYQLWQSDTNQPLDVVLGKLAVNNARSATWRYREFIDSRFNGSRAQIVAIASSIWSPDFVTTGLVKAGAKVGRWPGEAKDGVSAAQASTEVDAVSQAFADVLLRRAGRS